MAEPGTPKMHDASTEALLSKTGKPEDNNTQNKEYKHEQAETSEEFFDKILERIIKDDKRLKNYYQKNEEKLNQVKAEVVKIRDRAIQSGSLVYDKQGNFSHAMAPNREKSNLDEAGWLLVRTEAFKEWFGDWEFDAPNSSKVVDVNGEPMVVYHATTTNFNKYDPEKAMGGSHDMGFGVYFSDLEHNWLSYADKNRLANKDIKIGDICYKLKHGQNWTKAGKCYGRGANSHGHLPPTKKFLRLVNHLDKDAAAKIKKRLRKFDDQNIKEEVINSWLVAETKSFAPNTAAYIENLAGKILGMQEESKLMPMYVKLLKMKIVDEGYLDYMDHGQEKSKYDGKISQSLEELEQGIVFDSKNAKSTNNLFFSVDDDNFYH